MEYYTAVEKELQAETPNKGVSSALCWGKEAKYRWYVPQDSSAEGSRTVYTYLEEWKTE